MKLSPPMLKMLRCLAAGEPCDAYCKGRSEFGGSTKVLHAIIRRRLAAFIKGGGVQITDAGRQILKGSAQ